MITLPKRQEVYMKYSMRRQFAIMFIMLITGTILLCFTLNSTLLSKYYINNKKNALVKAYYSINRASMEGDITTEEYDIELQKICEKYNIHVLVADGESETVKASMNDPQSAINHLFDNIFRGVDESKLLLSTDNYKMQFVTDYRTQTGYLEMWGVLDNGYFFLLRSALESIQESVKISNRFLAYVGLGAVVVSALLVIWLSNRITKPILELADISERMKHLDFEAKYTGKEKTEISVLGNNINELSETLETTISELKTANNELLKDLEKKDKIDEMRKEFLSNVSHELKTPLTAISGYAELLQGGMVSEDQKQHFYQEIIKNSDRLLALINDIIRLSELDRSEKEPQFSEFDLYDAVNEFMEGLKVGAAGKNISLEFSGEHCMIRGNKDMIRELTENLVQNGIRYNNPGGKVVVRVIKKDRPVLIVKDDGIGIPASDQERVFERFYRVDKSRSKATGGTGLGLAIVKHIVELHDAKILLDSAPGVGTTIEVVF